MIDLSAISPPELDACRFIVAKTLFRSMVQPGLTYRAGRITKPMFDHLVDHCGLAPGMDVDPDGTEHPSFQVWDPEQAMRAVGAMPWPREPGWR